MAGSMLTFKTHFFKLCVSEDEETNSGIYGKSLVIGAASKIMLVSVHMNEQPMKSSRNEKPPLLALYDMALTRSKED